MMKRSRSDEHLDPAGPFAVVMLLCLVLVVFGGHLAYSLFFHTVSASWEKVPAVVVDIDNQPKEAKLRYRYTYQGQSYTGDRYQYLSPGTGPEKQEINEGFHRGDSLTIHVNPRKPSQSVVQRRPIQLEDLGSHLLVIGFALGASVVYFSRRRALAKRDSR